MFWTPCLDVKQKDKLFFQIFFLFYIWTYSQGVTWIEFRLFGAIYVAMRALRAVLSSRSVAV